MPKQPRTRGTSSSVTMESAPYETLFPWRGALGHGESASVGGARVSSPPRLRYVSGTSRRSGSANRHLGFDAKAVGAVLLSHAHIDHSGALPVLPRQGFAGKVYLTRASADLAGIMLEDSARIQENRLPLCE